MRRSNLNLNGNKTSANLDNIKTSANLDNIKKLTLGSIILSESLLVDNSNVSLGSEDYPIKDIWVSNNTLHIGKTTSISVNPDGELKVIKKVVTADGVVTEEVSDIGGGSANENKQTFIELLTQQPNKFKEQGTPTRTSVKIDISWNYDDIIPKHKDTTIIAKLAHFTEKQSYLPFINTIHFDISSSATLNLWVEWTKKVKTISNDYNIVSFKTLQITKGDTGAVSITATLGKEGSDNPFDIRVYGKNNSNDYPTIDVRALVFTNLYFTPAVAPPAPTWGSETIFNDYSFTSTYTVDATENGKTSSTAVIISTQTDYSQNETLASTIYPVVTETSTAPVENLAVVANANFNISLTSLRAGTKYNYKVKVKNNINVDYSEWSTDTISSTLQLPGNNSINTIVVFTASVNNHVTTPLLLNKNVIYIQTDNTTGSYTGSFDIINDLQTIQVTNPYGTNQQTETVGYGKWIDNSQNLVKIECLVNDSLKQTILFHGFNTATKTAGTATIVNANSNTFNYFSSLSQSDIWANDVSRKGFRIKGGFVLNDINYNEALDNIGAARTTAHKIKYKYYRHSDVGGSGVDTLTDTAVSEQEFDVYIDTLTDPAISANFTTATVVTVIWTMGIPSVKTMSISFTRTYSNINSAHKFIPGNRIIATINDIEKTNKTTIKNIALAQITGSGSDNKVIGDGTYTYTTGDMKVATDSYYDVAYYDEAVGLSNPTTVLNITEYVMSLKKPVPGTNTLSVSHFFDIGSYKNTGSASISRKFTYTDVWEITNTTELVKLNTDVGGIGVTQYTTHNTIPKDWTLLYLNGQFRTNKGSTTYPNVNSYEYNSIVSDSGQYSAGAKAYSLEGTQDDTNGYKWIVFKLSMGQKTNTNISGTITYYYDVYSYLTGKGISTTTVTKIRDKADTTVIAFVQQNVGGTDNDISRIGNLGLNVKSTDLWYGKDSQVSYSTMTASADKAAYGCRYPASTTSDTSTSWGPMLNTSGDDTIYLFLGLKNSVSLS